MAEERESTGVSVLLVGIVDILLLEMTFVGHGRGEYNWLSHVAFGLLALSFVTTNLRLLRLTMIISNLALASWGALVLRGPAAISCVLWNSLFVTINAAMLLRSIQQRKEAPHSVLSPPSIKV